MTCEWSRAAKKKQTANHVGAAGAVTVRQQVIHLSSTSLDLPCLWSLTFCLSPPSASIVLQMASYGRLGAEGLTIDLLMERIRQLEQRQTSSHGATRVLQRPLDLPSPKKEIDGSIKVTSVYHWMKMVLRAVNQLHLPREYVLFQLANESKLPSEWREVLAGSDDLDTAFQRIRQRVPPLQASFPELVASLTNKPSTSGLNAEVIERCGEHLSSISALQGLFLDQDITRENCLAALASVGQTHELNAMMVQSVRQFDWHKRLPATDPDHRSYVDQLKSHLEDQRQIRQDIEASILCGRTGDGTIATIPSFAAGIGKSDEREEEEEEEGQGVGDEEQEYEDAESSEEEEEEKESSEEEDEVGQPRPSRSCVICQCSPSHPPYLCGRLEDIRRGIRKRPAIICPRCCTYRGSRRPHPSSCHLRSSFGEDNEGRERWRSYLCRCGSNVHYRLCSCSFC